MCPFSCNYKSSGVRLLSRQLEGPGEERTVTRGQEEVNQVSEGNTNDGMRPHKRKSLRGPLAVVLDLEELISNSYELR